ncbi:hypothetical protein F4678DRAFT_451345 [Xylaria arbuscula]|nr:hypothetical protein F4678DRAFT_451345 [Xylaria arbuscula]
MYVCLSTGVLIIPPSSSSSTTLLLWSSCFRRSTIALLPATITEIDCAGLGIVMYRRRLLPWVLSYMCSMSHVSCISVNSRIVVLCRSSPDDLTCTL